MDKEKLKKEAINTAFDVYGSSAGAYGFLFDAGWDARSSADSWVRTDEMTPDDLPHGDYPIRRESEPLMTVTGFYDGRWWDVTSPTMQFDDVIAYYPVPPFEGEPK